MSLFGPPDLEKLIARRDSKKLIKMLNNCRDEVLFLNIIDALGQIGSPDAIAKLFDLFLLKNKSIQSATARALAQIGPPAVDWLVKILQYSNKMLKKDVIMLLGGVGGSKAINTLIALLGTDYGIQEAVENALVMIGDPAVNPLMTVLGLQSKAPSAIRILGKIGNQEAIKPLADILNKGESGTGVPAALALARIGGKEAYDALKACFQRKAGEDVAAALNRINWDPGDKETAAWYWAAAHNWQKLEQLGSWAFKPLVAALENQNFTVRSAAAETLGRIGNPESAEQIASLLKDKHYGVRSAASKALINLGQPGIDLLVAALDQKDTAMFAAAFLANIGDRRAIRPIAEKLQEPGIPSDTRVEAADNLGKIKDNHAVQPLIALLADHDRKVVIAAIQSLAALYKSGILDDKHKQLILAQGSRLENTYDVKYHADAYSCGEPHEDENIEKVHHTDFHDMI